jgi:hypothetical protein
MTAPWRGRVGHATAPRGVGPKTWKPCQSDVGDRRPDSTVKTIAFGVAIDAFMVRMTFVPAVLGLLGRRSWWLPAWLARILPSVDIEDTDVQQGPRDSGGSLRAA